jgi:DNA primase
MIPETTLNQIQERVDIAEIVGAHVQLRRAGRNFKACCPFHMEKTPSFHVNVDKQIFHCFGCGVGGNVFSFLMKIEKKDFREVVEQLAERTGIEIPKDRAVNAEAEMRRSELLDANRKAAEFYQTFLWKEPQAQSARNYLRSRGLSEKTVREFQLGFAPEAWETLTTALKKSLSEKLLERAGLAMPGKEGKGHYDRFRKRIIFPILDQKGACIAFGGRVIDDTQPKYLNSPETEIYVKGRHLYGLFQARTAIRTEDAVIVVEGYMDVIGCHQAGVTNAVASLGTALTNEQARLVKRHTQNVFILYDADAAGESATLRGLEIFLEEGMEVRIVRLPDGHDPDSYILKHGIAAFKKAMSEAKSLFDYKLALLKQKYPAKTVEGRVKIANEMVSLFSKVRNEMLVSAWMQELAKELGISESAVRAEIEKAKGGSRAQSAPKLVPGLVKTPETATPLARQARMAGINLLGLLIEEPEFIARARQELVLSDFEGEIVARIAERLFSQDISMSVSEWMNAFQGDADASTMIAQAMAEAEKSSDKNKAYSDCVKRLKEFKIKAQKSALISQMSSAPELVRDFNELNKGMKKTHEKI